MRYRASWKLLIRVPPKSNTADPLIYFVREANVIRRTIDDQRFANLYATIRMQDDIINTPRLSRASVTNVDNETRIMDADRAIRCSESSCRDRCVCLFDFNSCKRKPTGGGGGGGGRKNISVTELAPDRFPWRSSSKPPTNSIELRVDREQVVLVNLPHPACVFVLA